MQAALFFCLKPGFEQGIDTLAPRRPAARSLDRLENSGFKRKRLDHSSDGRHSETPSGINSFLLGILLGKLLRRQLRRSRKQSAIGQETLQNLSIYT